MKFSKNRKRLKKSQVREPDMVPYRQYENNLNNKYVYHRRYVNEVTKDSDKSKQKKEKLKKSTKPSNSTFTHHLFNISYEVPIQQLREKSTRNILSTLVIRSMVLLKLDSLIILEEIENNWNGWKRFQAV
jgi:anaerobic C4-dicarboxylate transporter